MTFTIKVAALVSSACLLGALSPKQAFALSPVRPDEFCPTSGRVTPAGPMLKVDDYGMRGVAARADGHQAELRFTPLGPSRETKPLADGEMRRQIGLKLRAHDTCNIVYVMWRLQPTQGIFVSVKRNTGQTTHAQCADRGYLNLARAQPAPAVADHTEHVLRATITGDHLEVVADRVRVWDGKLPEAAFAFDGPVGVRSDNGSFEFQLLAPESGAISCQKPD